MRRHFSFLLLAAAAGADDEADAVAYRAMRDYHASLLPNAPGIESVRDRLVPVMKRLGPKVGPSVRNQIRRGFDRKYRKDLSYHRCLCEILAAGGDPGMNILYRQYKASSKDTPLCVAVAESFGSCGDDLALDHLLKMAYDNTPEVAAAAVKACANHAKVKVDRRKAAVKQLIELYGKVTDESAGKPPESVLMRMYVALRPAMDGTLKAMTGESLDSAAAWKAWFQENAAGPWPE
jgi:hypothetical protein